MRFCIEIAAFFAFSCVFIMLSTKYLFPPVRIYMYVGILLGAFLYSKTWHRILDFCARTCYNILNVKVFSPFKKKIALKWAIFRQKTVQKRAKIAQKRAKKAKNRAKSRDKKRKKSKKTAKI